MKKYIYLEFSCEEAELLTDVFTRYLEQRSILQLKVPAVEINFNELDFIHDSIELLGDAVLLKIDVIIQCEIKIKWVLYHLAMITASEATNDNDHIISSCIIKLLYAAKDGE